MKSVPRLAPFALAVLLAPFFAATSALSAPGASNELVLWYPRPADQWTEALPVGNGRLAAMDFGGTADERLALNEDTVWAGSPHNNNMPTARDAIPEIRRLIF